MTLVRYQKPRPRIFNNLFEDFFNDDFYDHVEKINRKALANVMENDNEVTLELLVPGFSKEQITVEVNDNVLTVKGEIKIETIDDKKRYNRQEFNQSNFERTFTLQDNLDDDKITAKYENGVLFLSIPKLEVEEKKKKLINIF